MAKNLWFDLEELSGYTDSGSWARGMALYKGQHAIKRLDILPEDTGLQLTGAVQGSEPRPYSVSVELELSAENEVRSWNSTCSCPVGGQCKHGVALLLEATLGSHAEHTARAMAGGGLTAHWPAPVQRSALHKPAPSNQTRREAYAQAEAEKQLLHWLQDMDRASGHVAQAGASVRSISHRAGAAKPEQYLYLLSLSSYGHIKPLLQLDTVISYPKQYGGWAKPRAIRHAPYPGDLIHDNATDADRDAIQLIRAQSGTNFHAWSSGYSCTPEGRAGVLALELAASTGRLFMNNGQGAPAQPLVWGPPLPVRWEWQEVKATAATAAGHALRARPVTGNATLCLNNPPLYLDAERGLCGLVESGAMPPARLQVLLKAPPLQSAVLQKHQGKLLQYLRDIPPPPGIRAATALRGIVPTAYLHLSPVSPADAPLKGLMRAQLQFDYQGHRGWWPEREDVALIERESGNVLLHRDKGAERGAIERLLQLGMNQGSAGQGVYYIPGDQPQQRWLLWADEDYATLKGAAFTVTLDAALDNWITRADTLCVKMQGKASGESKNEEDSEHDEEAVSPWFDLSLGMEINGQRHNILPWLPELLTQAAAQPPDPTTGLPSLPPFVYLRSDNGGFIRLPTAPLAPWMAALLELVGDRVNDFSGDSLRLSRLDALRTSAALGEGAIWEGAHSLREMLRQLGGQAELPVIPLPPGVLADLRPYQQQGLNWLQFLRRHGLCGILADDMGLGKTLQTLVHIQVEKDAGRLTHPALIIAPVSLMGNWQREAARFCPRLSTVVLHGKDRHVLAGAMSQYDIVIAPYSLLQRDRERWLKAKWHLAVLDEAQNIKNASTNAAQVVSQLQARHRLCLSGTPMENHLGEIWSLFHYLMPGFLGSQKRFATLFRTPIEKQGDAARMVQLRARVTPFMLRRTKALVASELPPKVETVMRVELAGKQADLYETIRLGMERAVREALTARGLAKSHITILDALLKLRQVCCDPRLVPLTAAKKVTESAKLEQLMEMLPEMLAEGRRILLFSQFTSMLELIEAELASRQLSWVKLTGQSQKRDALIDQFTSGKVPLFLISLKAGGTGLNLPQADTVIHYDPWWNPAVENQATDRAHRIGQTQSVWVVKLVAQGTIEERILSLQERKAALANDMYSGAAGRKQPLFTESDLSELLKPLSAD